MYSIKKVSELLGIPAVTIRAWENRYHMIAPDRSDGGHRLYSEEDISTLKWLKEQIEVKHVKISEAVRLLKQRPVQAPAEQRLQAPANRTYDEMAAALYRDLTNLNTKQANEAIDLAFSLYHFEDVFHKILVPVLVRIGTEWEAGNISVAHEHFSSQLILQRFSQFFRVLPIHQHLPKVLAFCPEGENHHIGLMLFCLFLRKKGIDVIYLGPNTPLSGLSDLIRLKQISAVAISITIARNMEPLESWIGACLQQHPDIMFALGGKGLQAGTIPVSPNIYNMENADWEVWYQKAILRASGVSLA